MRNKELDNLSEIQILARIAIQTNIYFEYNYLISSDLFEDLFNKSVFLAIEELIKDNKPINFLSVSRKINTPDSVNKVTHIFSSLSYEVPLKTHLLSLNERRLATKINKIADKIKGKLAASEMDIFDLITETQKDIADLLDIKSPENIKIDSHIDNLLKKIEENNKAMGVSGVPTGFKDIDRFTTGLQGGNLIVLAGATSMGKTAFALSFIRNMAVKYNLPCLYISREMTSLEITTRLTSMEAKIDSKKILSGKLNILEHQQLSNNITSLYKSNLFIDTDHKSHINNILATIHSLHSIHGIKIAVVDYLQKISYPNIGWNREREVAEISWALQNKGKELNIPIVLLCQLSREVEKNKDCIPRLSNLRESGQIEQAADVVMFVYRPEYYGIKNEIGSEQKGNTEIIIAKGRNIGTASIDIQFHEEFTEFTDKEIFKNSF